MTAAPACERQPFLCSPHEIRFLLRLRQLEHSGDDVRIVYDVRAHAILERSYTHAELLDRKPAPGGAGKEEPTL